MWPKHEYVCVVLYCVVFKKKKTPQLCIRLKKGALIFCTEISAETNFASMFDLTWTSLFSLIL